MERKHLLFALFLLPLACSAREASTKLSLIETWILPGPVAPADPVVAPADPVIATVDGVPITAAELQARMKNGQLTAEEALEEAIADQLVLAHALKNVHPQDLSDAFKAAAVFHLITHTFEPESQPETIPDDLLRGLYDELQKPDFSEPHLMDKKFIFSHGEWRACQQLVVPGTELADDESSSTAESLLRLVRDRYSLTPVSGADAFRNSAWHLQDSYVPVRFEALPPLSATPDENTYRFGGEFDPEFVKVLFSLPAVGSHSDVFPTKFGLHWVYLAGTVPERRSSFEEVREELRNSIADAHRASRFQDWLSRLRRTHGVLAPGMRN